jgi:hypothetical protein
MIEVGGLIRMPRVFVEEIHQSLICILIQVMNLVSSGKEVGHSLRRRLVDNGRGDDICHVPVVIRNRNFEFGIRVESADSCQMDITPKNCDTNGKFSTKSLELLNEIQAFFFVSAGSVMVIKIIQQINTSVEMIEKSSS